MIDRRSLMALVGNVRADHGGDGEACRADDEEEARNVQARALCRTAKISAPPTMKAAFITLTAAMTRARRSAPAQT